MSSSPPAERAHTTRILGLVEGDPATALSGVGGRLFDALDERLPVVGRIDYSPHGARRLALAAATFHPARARWRGRFHTSRLSQRVLSRELRRRIAGYPADFDVALQVHGWVSGQPKPYALFIDQTRLMADRGWPQWLPLGSRERSEVLRLERQMYTDAFHVFAMGIPGRDSVVGDYGVDPSQVSVVGGGVGLSPLPYLGEPASEPRILFVGREFERKGGDSLVSAFSLVRRELPDATLHLVGGAKRRGPGIVSHGRVADRNRLREFYRSAAVFCLPSLYEPFGLVLAEAMAHGVPCVGTQVQSIPEILDEGKAGLLVPPGAPEALAEALLRVLQDAELARSLGLAGRKMVEREHTWSRVVDRMSPVIDGVASLQAEASRR